MKSRSDFAYQAIYRYLARLADEKQGGLLLKMPSLRQLANRLGVSISTVQRAYSLLETEGRVYSLAKSGYYSAPLGQDRLVGADCEGDLLQVLQHNAQRPGMVLLGGDDPTLLHPLESPLLAMERELIRHYPRAQAPGFQPFGDAELRSALAARYTLNAEHCWHADHVYIAPDLSGAFKAVLETLGLRGAKVLVESPCAWTLLHLLQSFDIQVVELPLDQGGNLDPEGLDDLLQTNHIGLVVLPSGLNPVRGSVRLPANNQAIATVLNRHKVWVLENDTHSELQFVPDPLRLRQLIDPQRLVIIGAFDKRLGPEAPYGYLLCQNLEAQWQRYFLLRAFKMPPVRQRAIARLCSNGRLDSYLKVLRETLIMRAQSMTQLLDEHMGGLLRYEVPEGGCGIWAESASVVDMRRVFDVLLAQRIVVTPGELFSLRGDYGQYLRLSFAIDWSCDPVIWPTALAEALKGARHA
ncbi:MULTISPECIES: PLP-dependent aminotransferase family protein [Pseudomonas syringae group]|uniref:aminotransferase-like domain-containing protein n=1 Tax=Pseudomonas syringae group TaxID=136849 RepID=UPI0006B56172|nr:MULTISPECIES: PLP-dependent aminotransferase family protein [Pseudomonas syringae group]KPB49781.1 GntR family transcriptional regulator [Pseudomonas coronafaciens pv. oryzae]KPY02327.1 GntR family transcriptional regulator [Pseudomonas coronafaciens pv. oryzae]KPZ25750.1 GntR family transcriptional regulator [Pseudomonas coronafaciens pv. zizaniae]MCF5802789.1 GntR family transcriptional regulator [Pseudomonas tremae]MCF5809574.1 GntR family transcriptional regulator [Pseudomonas tremae]